MYEESPLDRIQCDLIKIDENLKSDDARYNYIFTAVDHHSKKAWAKCLRNKNAESVGRIIGKLFDKIFAQRGEYPKLLHTDNGGEFRNELLKKICTEKGIKQIHGAPYHS
jgi:transposase InsO family protein